MSKTNKYPHGGFTLIELLVVVLIIGILAAIALPQYRKSVAKAKLAQIVMATKSVKSAMERYYLVNNQYTNTIANLDVEIDSNVICDVGTGDGGYVQCLNDKFDLWSYMNIRHSECAAKTNDENSPLVNACKDFTEGTCYSSSGSSTCYALELRPCVICVTSKNII